MKQSAFHLLQFATSVLDGTFSGKNLLPISGKNLLPLRSKFFPEIVPSWISGMNLRRGGSMLIANLSISLP